VITIVKKDVSLKEAHSVLKRFHELLREKDIIWGMTSGEDEKERLAVLTLLVKKWGEQSDKGNTL
jgi:cell division GTPase FtsZ